MIDTYLHVAGLIRSGRLEDARAHCARLDPAEHDSATRSRLALIVARRCEEADTAPRGPPLPDDPMATLLIAGSIARDTGDMSIATRLFRQAQQASPDNPEPAYFLCSALLDAGQPEASSLLAQLLTLDPGSASGWSEIGDALIRADRSEAALAAFDRACRIAPTPALYIARGKLLRQLERTDEAIAAYAKAHAMAPINFEAVLGHGLCLKQAGQLAAAATILGDAVRLRPRSAAAWFALGVVEQDGGAFSAAIAAYARAIDNEPRMAESQVNMGICWQELGDLDAAKAAYTRAMRLRPGTFGRIAQALTMAPKGELWLDLEALRLALA